MRIGIDVRPALAASTGVGRYLRGLVPALLEAGQDVVAFSSSLKSRLDPGLFPGAHLVDRRIPVAALNWLWGQRRWPPLELLVGGVEVAHSATPLPIPARRAARTITIHDLYFLDHPESAAPEVRRDWLPRLRDAVREADAVIAVSRATAAAARERLEVPEGRLWTAPHGLEPRWWEAPPAAAIAELRARLGLPGRFLLAVGALEPRKNYPLLLGALAALRRGPARDLRLVIAGPDGLARGAVDAAARRLGLADALLLTGWQSDDRLQALYGAAEALVLPSLDEGFGFPLLEAMAAGCPVVAARSGALPEVGEEAALYADPGEESSWVSAIGSLLEDRPRREDLVARGRKRARAFTWQESARRHLAAFAAAREARA